MYKNFFKRPFDFILAVILLLLLLPIFIVLIVIIRLESSGPAFFVQERLAKNGNIFKIIKFRTMVEGSQNMGSGIRVTKGDNRITKVGSFLRSSSLDELPQLINVLKGEMSFVGPRPPLPFHPYNRIENYPTKFQKRFLVKPGVTGLAQVRLRNSVNWEGRILVDLEYVDNISFIFDLKILFLTILAVVKKDNIYGVS